MDYNVLHLLSIAGEFRSALGHHHGVERNLFILLDYYMQNGENLADTLPKPEMNAAFLPSV